MPPVLIDTNPLLSFKEAFEREMAESGVELSPWAQHYLVDLLCYKVHSLPLEEPLVLQMSSVITLTTARARLEGYLTIGECSLLSLSLFKDNLVRRGMSPRYFVHMGSSAYEQASTLAKAVDGFQGVYKEISLRFSAVLPVLTPVGSTWP